MYPGNSYAIRPGRPDDAEPLRRLAELDSQAPLTGDILVAIDEHGALLAAYAPASDRSIADPFRHSAAAVIVLRTRAEAHAAARRTPSLAQRLRGGLRIPVGATTGA